MSGDAVREADPADGLGAAAALPAGLAWVHLQWFAPEDEGKTEDPTEYRLRKAREEGRVAKSQDLVGAVGLMLPVVALAVFAPWIFMNIQNMLRWFLEVAVELDPVTEGAILGAAFLSHFARLVLPVAVVAVLAALFGNLLQVGFLFTTKPLKPDFKRVVPHFGQYLKRTVFSGEGLYGLAKNLIKIAAILVIAVLNIVAEIPAMTRLFSATVWTSTIHVSSVALRIILEAALLLLALAVPDYLYQKRLFKKNLKMTKQEVKEEYKMFEGDPKIKGRLRERMRELLSRNMAANVPKADVVVTNPTHYAVAIEYNPQVAAVPVVSAKGQDEVALRIRAIAREHGVPVVENKPLARALYASAEVGDPVPEEYYQAIAGVLAHVAKIDKKLADKLAALSA
ncbi:MAG: flagellar biosynthesis protein FlhB [Spirochaetales bacterium]|nr:flagellar biosynthesis protein FlhB [Spirochaetales bacterium]MBP7262725.1 flagellar biosynthesis protein FlhB [Spirochaetia bacterium]